MSNPTPLSVHKTFYAHNEYVKITGLPFNQSDLNGIIKWKFPHDQ